MNEVIKKINKFLLESTINQDISIESEDIEKMLTKLGENNDFVKDIKNYIDIGLTKTIPSLKEALEDFKFCKKVLGAIYEYKKRLKVGEKKDLYSVASGRGSAPYKDSYIQLTDGGKMLTLVGWNGKGTVMSINVDITLDQVFDWITYIMKVLNYLEGKKPELVKDIMPPKYGAYTVA